MLIRPASAMLGQGVSEKGSSMTQSWGPPLMSAWKWRGTHAARQLPARHAAEPCDLPGPAHKGEHSSLTSAGTHCLSAHSASCLPV